MGRYEPIKKPGGRGRIIPGASSPGRIHAGLAVLTSDSILAPTRNSRPTRRATRVEQHPAAAVEPPNHRGAIVEDPRHDAELTIRALLCGLATA
jgi:hypothetical protein